MCYAVQCAQCGKATWDGCGEHIDEALASYSEEQRCTCR